MKKKMKTSKFYSVLAVAIMTIAFVACTKSEQPNENMKVGKIVKIGASKQSKPSQTKTTYEYLTASKSLDFKWAAGDGLSVTYHDDDLDIDNAENYDIETGVGTKSATFIVDGMSMIDDQYVDKLYVYYPKGNRTATAGEYQVEYDISSQTGKLSDLGKYDLMAGVATAAESYDYNDETIYKVSLESSVSIIRIASGTVVAADLAGVSASKDITFRFTSDAIATRVTYKGAGKVLSGNTVTVATTVKNGALESDLYIAYINREDANELKPYEYGVTVMVDENPAYTYEAVLTKRPAATGETPFTPGVLYSLTKLNLTKTGGVSYTLKTLTFEDADYKGSDPSLIWSALIDNPEYYGSLLYGRNPSTDPYLWYDEGNTEIYSIMPTGDFWSGGEAISNYVLKGAADYTRQLSVPIDNGAGKGGNNGSDNFCIHFGYNDGYSAISGFAFYDDVPRIIDHMYIAPTSYVYDSIVNGNAFTTQTLTTPGFFFKVIVKGFVGSVEVGTKEFYIAKDGNIVNQWTKWSLISLGKVDRVEFDIAGSDVGAWGLNTPGYFAYDDVAVRFE